MKCRKAYAIIPVGENDRSAHVAQQKAPEVATPGLFGYNAGGENGCPSVPLLPPVLHCPFRRKKVKGGLRPFFICCTR